MSSAVQCLVFDRDGGLLAEIEPDIEYAYWRLNNVGRARFNMPYSDSKCTPDNLRAGNRLLLQFENGLPDWGGVIDLPRRRTSTGIVATAYTGEWLLGWRYTSKGRYFSDQEPGYIFSTLISEENAEYPTGIIPYGYYAGGTERTIEYHYHQLLKRCQKLAKLTGNDFHVEPRYEGGVLTFRAFWYERRGGDVSDSVMLIEDLNADIVLDEQGPIVNRVILVGEGSTWGDERIDSISEDSTSRATYGYREWAEVQGGVKNQATLDANAGELLDAQKDPQDRLSVYALNMEPALFSAYSVGDIVSAQAFLKSEQWYYEGDVRVVAREWTPWDVCRLEVEVWRG
jgi:hypothetical protein